MSDTALLIRAVSSFYYVWDGAGLMPCRARGRLRLCGSEPLPGDRVRWRPDPDHPGYGVLLEIMPRHNSFVRPAVANVDRIVFVASDARPRTDPYLIDTMCTVAEQADCEFLLCLNKSDLSAADELYETYLRAGVGVLRTSAETGEGIPELESRLRSGISVFTGNSGVGKSSLLNDLLPGLDRQTAAVSEKHGRGKHTTRHTELFRLPPSPAEAASGERAAWIADTPGFAALELKLLTSLTPETLPACFPEFPQGKCRFPDCRHDREPSCAVREAVQNGLIPESRYRSYLRMLSEL